MAKNTEPDASAATRRGWPWERFEELARAGNFAEAICAYVEDNGRVTFAELSARLSPFMETHGEHALERLPNLIVWAGMSQAFIDLIRDLLHKQRLMLSTASLWIYLLDGMALNLPLAKSEREYKTPHWLPCNLAMWAVEPSKRKS